MALSPGNVEVVYSNNLVLNDEALELVRFDIESVAQLIRAEHGETPGLWLARPEGYMSGGHTLRDDEAIRLIAYCRESRTVYATDGCNACRHVFPKTPGSMSDEELRTFSADTQLPYPLLGKLVEQLATI